MKEINIKEIAKILGTEICCKWNDNLQMFKYNLRKIDIIKDGFLEAAWTGGLTPIAAERKYLYLICGELLVKNAFNKDTRIEFTCPKKVSGVF